MRGPSNGKLSSLWKTSSIQLRHGISPNLGGEAPSSNSPSSSSPERAPNSRPATHAQAQARSGLGLQNPNRTSKTSSTGCVGVDTMNDTYRVKTEQGWRLAAREDVRELREHDAV